MFTFHDDGFSLLVPSEFYNTKHISLVCLLRLTLSIHQIFFYDAPLFFPPFHTVFISHRLSHSRWQKSERKKGSSRKKCESVRLKCASNATKRIVAAG